MRSYLQYSGLRGALRQAAIWTARVAGLLVAATWRRMLWRTTFVAITGSVGKTTAKDLTAAVLSSRHRVSKTFGTSNHFRGLPRTLLLVRPWHRYAVVEVGLDGPGQMRWFARVVKPDIAIWLGVAATHTDKFASLAETAAEKSRLIDALGRGKVAILNNDDAHVQRYTPPSHVRVIRFGTSESDDIHARRIDYAWPERLQIHATTARSSHCVRTQLVGTHWLPSVLAAIAVGEATGIRIEEAADAIASVAPIPARLSPAALPNGATVIRDEFNGSIDTLNAAFEALRAASASRKILVMSDVSDCSDKPRRRLARIGRRAAAIFDGAVFIGGHANHGERGAIEAGMRQELVRSFVALEPALEFLRRELREGDLVLLRGRNSDHLSRIYLGLLMEVHCWRSWCPKRGLCDTCGELTASTRTHTSSESS